MQLDRVHFCKEYELKNKKTWKIHICQHINKNNIKNLEKFRKEIKTWMKLDHPNLIKLYEVFNLENSIYLLTEECNGEDLLNKIIQKRQVFSEKEAAIIFS